MILAGGRARGRATRLVQEIDRFQKERNVDACGDKGESRRPATIAARTTEFLAPHVQRCDKARRALEHDNSIT